MAKKRKMLQLAKTSFLLILLSFKHISFWWSKFFYQRYRMVFLPFIVYFIFFCSDDLLDVLMGTTRESTKSLFSEKLLETEEITMLIKRLSKLPLSDSTKTDAWYKILGNRSISEWSSNDWKIFQPLIPYLPLDLLMNVDFGDPEILEIFAQVELQRLQRSMVAELLLKKWGSKIFNGHKKLIQMGNIFCGLADNILAELDEEIIRNLLVQNFFKNIKTCSPDKLNILSKKATSFKVLGPLRTWTPYYIEMAGSLIAGISDNDIQKIRPQSFSGLAPEVIRLMPMSTLTKMEERHLKAFKKPTLLAWRRETKDMRPLHSGAKSVKIPWTLASVVLLITGSTIP